MKVNQIETNIRPELKYQDLRCGECYAAITGRNTHAIVMMCEKNGHDLLIQLENGIMVEHPEKYKYWKVNANLTYSF